MFSKEIEDKAKAHAIAEFPKESVGMIVDDVYLPLENVHKTPENDFQARIEDYAQYFTENKIQGIIHSHTSKMCDKVPFAYPSKLDMETQINWGVPFGIIYTDGERANNILYFGDTVERKPLEGREFIHGVQDCYSLIRDYYKENKNIWIKDFPRNWEWWRKGEKLYKLGFESAGFQNIPISEVEKGDVLLMAVTAQTMRENNPCHAGIYLGNELFLHHKCNGVPYDKSCVSSIQHIQRYTKYITHCLRFVG